MRILMLTAAALAAQTPSARSKGTITVERARGQSPIVAEGIEHALRDADFIVLPTPSKSRYVARFVVKRHASGILATDDREAPASVGQTGNWGARLHVTLPSHKTALHALIITSLTIEIVDRATGTAVWHAGAITTQVELLAADTPAAIADKLAGPLVRRFPVSPDRVIAIP